MKQTTFQHPELRDANDNIIQQGAFGKNTALANATNDGWIDYVANDLEFLYDIAKDEVVPVPSLPASGQTNKTYLLTTNGKTYRWSGTAWVELTNSEAVGRAENAATLAEQWATKIDGTVADNEYSAKYYANAAQQSADDAQDTADDIATHLVQIDKNTGGVSKNSKRISNIEKLLQGNLYDYQTDDTSAYTKTVPAGAMPYAGLEKLGGKTLVWNQLCDFHSNSTTLNGITWTKNADNSYTANGTADSSGSWLDVSATFSIPTDHKILIKGCPAGGSYKTYNFRDGYIGTWDGGDFGNGFIYAQRRVTKVIARMQIEANVTVSNVTFRPLVFDLTLMFGAGNEPSTVAEFEAMFPASYYSYNAGTLLSAGVTSVVSKDSSDNTLQTVNIPASIQALEGYGWSAGDKKNYIDFERKVYVQEVSKLSFAIANMNNVEKFPGWNNSGVKAIAGSDLNIALPNSVWLFKNGSACNANTMSNNDTLFLMDSGMTQTQWKETYPNLVVDFYIARAVPIETDISEYITDDNLIQVESGGTLTFPNSNGTDYQIPVPSKETYMINLQEAVSNG